ncbi:hypothetical protein GOP47_0020924 [Adiantum capillus-veneris]|uniref:non-specific serine/threonine protein kinase n=1 Tax=Adiantum capillus-veneris TaxID=13818 RepID=A0A9D4Z7F2_ADICA|nr:hypothetical protein GOP47_0020924 [Adiantum capillus-veneris]
MDHSTGTRGPSIHGSSDLSLLGYKVGKTLGFGSFGKVKLAEHELTGYKVAIKILNKRKMSRNADMEEKVRREIKILRLFMHTHIIRLYEVIETETDIYFVMEYVNSGELFDHIVEKGRLSEDEARRFFQQIISGVEYCHRNMVVHRDLKPENLLLDSTLDVKIADFGLSNVMHDGHFLKTSCGSPNYAAPEVISGKLYAGPEVDVWSCGVILYALLCGSLPFDDGNISNLFKKIKGAIYTLPSHLSAGARDLIPRMLVVDPLKRYTIPEIKQHPWFQFRLPRYLAVPPLDTAQQARRIDEDVLNQVVSLGFDRNHLLSSLQNRVQNKATVTFFLILDNQRRESNRYLAGDLVEAGSQTKSIDLAGSSSVRQYDNGWANNRVPRFSTERKWALGLQSRAHPREIMTEVLKALQELAVCWKKIGHYNMKCRWFPPEPKIKQDPISLQNGSLDAQVMLKTAFKGAEADYIGSRDDNSAVKFEVQLYKTKEDKYLLDLQRVGGSHFLFLDLCASFLAELRVL